MAFVDGDGQPRAATKSSALWKAASAPKTRRIWKGNPHCGPLAGLAAKNTYEMKVKIRKEAQRSLATFA